MSQEIRANTRKLLTPFAENLDENNILAEYPRPQLVRNSYLNLNGKWQYAILKQGDKLNSYDGEILVPFAPESVLSGVSKIVEPDEVLYYERSFNVPEDFLDDRTFLNFGAVDYQCEVFVNDKKVGSHKGGYLPFAIEVTKVIKSGENQIKVVVIDPTDKGIQARGKQTMKPGGIWYTPSSGIWQTVWLESVPVTYIRGLKIVPDIDQGTVTVNVDFTGDGSDRSVFLTGTVEVLDKGVSIAVMPIEEGKPTTIKLKDFKLWSPENPYLYDLKIIVNKDEVTSYFGMRKFSIGADEKGISRLMLNNKPYFHNGLLDQGYWSDGMYTPCSDEAMIFDIQTMKDMGFNMLRKHIKVEPMRWYYHCDRLGMLVWQDMVSGGDSAYSFRTIGSSPFMSLLFLKRRLGMMKDTSKNYKKFRRASKEGRDEFYKDMYGTMDTLMNVVSIALWVPFNEGWGQFDSLKTCEMMRKYDPTRLLDHASGWHDQGGPDLNSFHIYFTKYKFPKYDENDNRPIVLSEFGGFSHQVVGHTFSDKIFGYRVYNDIQHFADMYEKLFKENIEPNIAKGLSATVYTQVSDVEDEINGLLTYDRHVIKIPIDRMKAINAKIKL